MNEFKLRERSVSEQRRLQELLMVDEVKSYMLKYRDDKHYLNANAHEIAMVICTEFNVSFHDVLQNHSINQHPKNYQVICIIVVELMLNTMSKPRDMRYMFVKWLKAANKYKPNMSFPILNGIQYYITKRFIKPDNKFVDMAEKAEKLMIKRHGAKLKGREIPEELMRALKHA